MRAVTLRRERTRSGHKYAECGALRNRGTRDMRPMRPMRLDHGPLRRLARAWAGYLTCVPLRTRVRFVPPDMYLAAEQRARVLIDQAFQAAG